MGTGWKNGDPLCTDWTHGAADSRAVNARARSAVAGQDRHFPSQPHGVELNHPCGLTVDGTSPSASMCLSPSREQLRQRTASSRSEDALIRGGHPGTRCMTRLTVTGNECRRRVLLGRKMADRWAALEFRDLFWQYWLLDAEITNPEVRIPPQLQHRQRSRVR
ncbi:hypothetical protein WN48_08587 [Eufriesea mexicana]|nr:hypothetical protein WN48_08587 [Eufriesea mexicana]